VNPRSGSEEKFLFCPRWEWKPGRLACSSVSLLTELLILLIKYTALSKMNYSKEDVWKTTMWKLVWEGSALELFHLCL
jgi:hypothetical protein